MSNDVDVNLNEILVYNDNTRRDETTIKANLYVSVTKRDLQQIIYIYIKHEIIIRFRGKYENK